MVFPGDERTLIYDNRLKERLHFVIKTLNFFVRKSLMKWRNPQERIEKSNEMEIFAFQNGSFAADRLFAPFKIILFLKVSSVSQKVNRLFALFR